MTEALSHLPGELRIAPSPDELFDQLAQTLVNAATRAVGDREVFHLALSGGSTPEPFYVRLVTDPQYRAMPWQRTHVWLVDERRVPETDERSNMRMIRETLVEHVPIRQRQVHAVPVEAENPARAYERELREVIGSEAGATPRLDFVLLGMGDDAHTASLFPHSPALAETDRLIVGNDGPAVTPPPRVTMTYPLINAARHVAVLLTGGKKAATLRRVARQFAEAGPDVEQLPITGVNPLAFDARATMGWYLDAAAVGDAVEPTT